MNGPTKILRTLDTLLRARPARVSVRDADIVKNGMVGMAESRLRAQRNDPGVAVDLSEAYLFFCHARGCKNCGSGRSGQGNMETQVPEDSSRKGAYYMGEPRKSAEQFVEERVNFKALLAKNPNYFGNLPEGPFKPVKKIVPTQPTKNSPASASIPIRMFWKVRIGVNSRPVTTFVRDATRGISPKAPGTRT